MDAQWAIKGKTDSEPNCKKEGEQNDGDGLDMTSGTCENGDTPAPIDSESKVSSSVNSEGNMPQSAESEDKVSPPVNTDMASVPVSADET